VATLNNAVATLNEVTATLNEVTASLNNVVFCCQKVFPTKKKSLMNYSSNALIIVNCSTCSESKL
jgi:hypothetical protein